MPDFEILLRRGEDTKWNLKHVKDRAANLAERPQLSRSWRAQVWSAVDTRQ
jgi:hypothetical protein